MEKDPLPRRRPGRTRVSYHKKVTSVARKGGGSKEGRTPTALSKEDGEHRTHTVNHLNRQSRVGRLLVQNAVFEDVASKDF